MSILGKGAGYGRRVISGTAVEWNDSFLENPSLIKDRIVYCKGPTPLYLMAFLMGKAKSPTHEMFYFNSDRLTGVRQDEWKLLINNQGKKPIEHIDLTDLKLYNLEYDPGERYDFADKHPEIVEKLKRRLLEFDLEIIRTDLARTRK